MNEEKEEKTARLSRAFFSTSMPDEFKRVFIKVVQHTHFIPEKERTFLCDQIHYYEHIGDFARKELLDVLDDLKLFVMTPPENNISG